jgi:hypothetical protein
LNLENDHAITSVLTDYIRKLYKDSHNANRKRFEMQFEHGCAVFFNIPSAGTLQPGQIWLWANIFTSYQQETIPMEQIPPAIQEFYILLKDGNTKWDRKELFYRASQQHIHHFSEVSAMVIAAKQTDEAVHNSVAEYLRIPTEVIQNSLFNTSQSSEIQSSRPKTLFESKKEKMITFYVCCML